MEGVVTVVKSLVFSKKPPCLVTDILRDYKELEGEHLPYRKFGYQNPEEFLASSNAFILDRYGGNTYVAVKASAGNKSAHIQSMVRAQKATKQKKSKTAAVRFPGKTNQNWNKSSYSTSVYGQNSANNYRPAYNNRQTNNYNNYNRQPLRPVGDKNNNNQNNYQKKPQQQQQHSHQGQQQSYQSQQSYQNQPQQTKPNMVRSNSDNSYSSGSDNWRNPVKENYTNGKTTTTGAFSMPEEMRNRLSAIKPQQERREEPVMKADDLRNKLNASRQNNQAINSNVPKPQQPVAVAKQQPVPKPVDTNELRRQQNQSIATRLNLSNRAAASGSSPAPQQPTNISVIKDYQQYQTQQQPPQPKPQQPEKPFKFVKELSPIVQLHEYCNVRQIDPPQYQIFSYRNKFKCTLNVNNRPYFSDEFDSENSAKIACALEAIEEIKKKESIPVCTTPNYEVKIHEKLLQKSGGVFAKGFPQWFEDAFEQRIPSNWFQTIQKRQDMFSIENSSGDSLIFAKTASVSSASSSASSDMEYFSSGRMTLPFENKYWNLYITHCKSTVEVWGRLVGMGYSEKYENLINDIELHMLSNARRPQSISCGQIYLTNISDCWHRIRVEERRKNEFLCFYIDFGDEEWIDVEKIFVCEPKFLTLPPQGLVFSLFGLEDFSGNRCAERILNKELPNRSLVAEVLTKKEIYEQSFDEDSACGEYKIQVVLYDTSSNEDINLNESLGKLICDETPTPALKVDGLTTNVNVTHVDDTGMLYVQIRNSDWTYVEKLVNTLVESKQINQHKIRKNEMSMAGMYLVRSARNGPFIRAILNSPPNGESDIYDMFYVDYGSTAEIHISDIFRLDSLSAALAKYPSQALKVKLANIPNVTHAIIAKIKKMLPKNTSAIVKVITNARIQEVLLYARMDNGTMFNVNDSILIEMDLEKDIENGTGTNSKLSRRPKTTSPNPIPVSVEQSLPELQDYKIPEVNEYMDVLVTMCSNPLNFTVLPYEDNVELSKLMRDMKDYYSSTDEYIPADVIKEGEAYACKHNNYYQRCIITKVLPNPHFCVKLCDLGEVTVLSNDNLKTLPAKFRDLPKQAIKAKLYGIKPINTDWTLQDCISFKKVIVNKPFVSKIIQISKDSLDNDTTLELHLIDTTTENDIYIHQLLIDEGKAKRSDEC